MINSDIVELEQDFSLESSVEENGKFYIIGKALSKEFECEPGLNALAIDVKRQALTWRHAHPIEDKHKASHIYGRVVDGWVDNDFLMIKAELYDHTQDHKNLIEIIKKRDKISDPLSFSMHYRTYLNKGGKKYHWDVFEVAGTPYPACKECKITDFGVIKMEKKKEEITKDEKNDELDNELEKAIKSIKELEQKLNAKTNVLETYKAQIQKLESEMIAKDTELNDKIKVDKSLEDRVKEMELEINFLQNKKPILDKILEANSLIDERELKWLRTEDITYLKQRLELENKKADSKIITSELEQSAQDSKAKAESEEEKLEEVSYEHFVSQIDELKK